jgi:hypothetical protein
MFHGRDLLADQASELSGLADLVADERVDVVVVSGDIYDRAVPSGEAVSVCTRVLDRIRGAGARLVITPGNHDSAPRLGAFAEFAAAGGLHLRTRVAELSHPVLLEDEHGPVALYGIPYLEPEPARHSLGIEAAGHAGVLTEAMRRVRADLAARGPGVRSVVLAASNRSPASCSAASTTWRSVISMGRNGWPSICGIPEVRWRTRSPRRGIASRCGSWNWTPAVSPGWSGGGCRPRVRSPRSAGTSTSCSRRRHMSGWSRRTCRWS